ncbi:MAG TPA: tetratricopeptide repeat protein [Thermoanaerobaculia bacterium]|nr:tetratricopeptide repeat protein [Thermoanaerobaculia bacterium]
MPPSPVTAKIEELRFRVKTDPKSRLFYPLAEELRKIGLCDDAEQVLRTGLTYHPSYLSAWVSLGRVSREQGKSDDAIEALSKALQLDPGNVVAARLLADCYLAAGEKVEAIKKYKLVHALMPSDSDVEATIAQLERELTPIAPAEPEPEPVTPSVSEGPGWEGGAPPELPGPSLTLGVTHEPSSAEEAILTADDEPMLAAHDESPFEEPVEDFTAAAVEIEAPVGIHIEEAPLAAEVPTPWSSEEETADVFAPTEEEPPAAVPEPTDTVTMADLYARQGLVADARRIYETILQRDPDNESVREKLEALGGGEALMPVREKVARLEEWLAKMGRREVSHV